MSRAVVRVPTVEFARATSPSVADGGTVRRKGVIFRAGTYPYQNFSMSPDELRHVASTFKDAIKIDHGHPSVDGPLDFGRLESVEVSPDGTTLYGHTVHPAWVNTALADAKWLVSASFDRSTKAIRRLSLVTRPQISDAELQAAFACACGGDTHTTTEASPMAETEDKVSRIKREIEELDEDELAALGGDAEEDDVTTPPRSRGGFLGEVPVDLGPVSGHRLPIAQSGRAASKGGRRSSASRRVGGHPQGPTGLVTSRATGASDVTGVYPRRSSLDTDVPFYPHSGAISMDDDETDDGLDEAADDADTSDFAEDPEKEEMRMRLALLEERDARREVERRTLISADFAKDELRAGRILPTEAENAAAMMFQALADDDLDGSPVHFSRGGKPARGTREQMVRATFAARPSHGLARERGVDAPGMHLLDPDAQFSAGGETPQEYARRVNAKVLGRDRIAGAG